MNRDQQKKHFEDMVDKARAILLSKGNDYAVVEDRLLNFKQSGLMCNMSPVKVCLVQLSIKQSRLNNLIDSGKAPENEAIQDTFLDQICYTILADACFKESAEHDAQQRHYEKVMTLVKDSDDFWQNFDRTNLKSQPHRPSDWEVCARNLKEELAAYKQRYEDHANQLRQLLAERDALADQVKKPATVVKKSAKRKYARKKKS